MKQATKINLLVFVAIVFMLVLGLFALARFFGKQLIQPCMKEGFTAATTPVPTKAATTAATTARPSVIPPVTPTIAATTAVTTEVTTKPISVSKLDNTKTIGETSSNYSTAYGSITYNI